MIEREGEEPRCSWCRTVVAEERTGQPRVPCPCCGHTARTLDLFWTETIACEVSLLGLVRRNEQFIACFDNGRTDTSFDATLNEDGVITQMLAGESPQNEQGTREVCERLAMAMTRATAEPWSYSPPPERENGCDGFVVSSEGKCEVQVTRVCGINWQLLNKTGVVRNEYQVCKAVENIQAAIDHKTVLTKDNPRAIPDQQRSNLILAIDSSRVPAFALDQVIDVFRKLRVSGLGFKGIWLIGPCEELCWRLDGI